MKKLFLPIVTLAIAMLPAAASATPCRDSGTGKFAKCGAPGAVPASQYVAKTRASTKATHAAATPAATKVARCKTPKGQFVKCGTPGAVPA